MTVPTDLDRRFREAAVRSGLLDAAYDVSTAEIGPLLVGDHRPRPRTASRSTPTPSSISNELSHDSPAGASCGRRGRSTRRAASSTSTSTGRRTAFDLALDLRDLTPFTERVLRELALGSRSARRRPTPSSPLRVGNPKASRAVGMTMNRNRIPIVLPCHR